MPPFMLTLPTAPAALCRGDPGLQPWCCLFGAPMDSQDPQVGEGAAPGEQGGCQEKLGAPKAAQEDPGGQQAGKPSCSSLGVPPDQWLEEQGVALSIQGHTQGLSEQLSALGRGLEQFGPQHCCLQNGAMWCWPLPSTVARVAGWSVKPEMCAVTA